MLATAALLSATTATARQKFAAYDGPNNVHAGTRGTNVTRNGVDFWTTGTPRGKYQVFGARQPIPSHVRRREHRDYAHTSRAPRPDRALYRKSPSPVAPAMAASAITAIYRKRDSARVPPQSVNTVAVIPPAFPVP